LDPASDTPSFIYFVEKGCLEETIPGEGEQAFSRGVGSLVGVCNLLHPENKPYTEIKVKTEDTILTKISSDSLKSLISENEKFARDIYSDALFNCCLVHKEKRGKFTLEESHMSQFIRTAEFRKE